MKTLYFSITIPIAPIPKARPRLGKNGVFTPARTQNAENIIRAYLLRARVKKIDTGIPLFLEVIFSIAHKKHRDIPKLTRPDLDNYLKLIMDAGNNYLWNDDAQIFEINAKKIYSKNNYIDIRVFLIID